MKKTYKAAVFDLDGTLINSLPDLAASGNILLASYGMPPHPEDAYRYFVGNGWRKLVERIMPEADEGRVEEALARYKAIYEGKMTERTKPYDGIPELLRGLRERGLALAVCTNKHVDAAKTLVEKYFPEGVFSVVEGDRPGVPKKPDPAHLRAVMERLGVKPEETLYLGDSGVDMETASRGGAYPVGVLWGFREKEELISCGAKLVIAKPEELFEKFPFD